jgi:mRNA-degrading endonuclease RelE of RelBE toxin-antitoxin system
MVARYSLFWARAAAADLDYLGQRFGKPVSAAIKRETQRYLADQPLPAVGQRKALDENPLGFPYRLRLGDYRVYYDVNEEQAEVEILRVGYKPGETLYLQGQPMPMRD